MKLSTSSDADLIAACLAGDADSWDELILRYQGLIYALARRMRMTASDADDIFQNVCLRLYQHLGDIRDTSRLASWLTSTTRREVWHYHRNRDATLVLESGDPESEPYRDFPISGTPQQSPDEMVLLIEEADLLRRCMGHLPTNCRKLLNALYANESQPSYEEVAQLLGMPVGSIGPNRARCLKRLKKIYEQESR